MKTLTIGDTTYEIVDEEARESAGDLSDLTTTTKTDLVSAINEVAADAGQVDSVNGMTGTVVLTAADVGAASTGALTDETTARTAADAQLQGQITALGNGAPIPVETIAAMTVQTQVYLYTGSETGESTGYWYSYDSAQAKFVPRGEYGAGVIIDDTFTIPNAVAGSIATGQALAEKADATDVDVLEDIVDDVIDSETVTTWTTCDKDDPRFTEISGYISSSGSISSPSSDIHKTWYYVTDHDIDVYLTRATTTGQVRIGVYNDANLVSGNILLYGSSGTAGTMPTQDNPFHATAGQCVAVSIYNSSILDWVLHEGTASIIGTLKQTVGLTEQMETEVDEMLSVLTYGEDASEFEWVIGQVKDNGTNGSDATRVRTNTFIPVNEGDLLKFNDSDIQCGVALYSSNIAASFLSWGRLYTATRDTYEVPQDCYIRFTAQYSDRRSMTSEDLSYIPTTITCVRNGTLAARIEKAENSINTAELHISDLLAETDLISILHNLINYGYDTEESRDPIPSANDSTVFGYHREKNVITLTGGLDAKDTIIKLNGNIETTISTSTVRSWTASVPLEEDRLYRFTAQMVSGGLSTVENDDYDFGVSVYISGSSTSRGSYTVSADRKKFVREVIGEGALYNVCLYINSGVMLTDAKIIVIMEDITEDQEESGDLIETYFLQEMEDTVSKVRNCVDAPALVFPLVTDIHRYSSAYQTFDKMIANMRRLTEEVKCDFIVNLGDTIEGTAQQETSLGYAYDSSADFCGIGIPYFFANGNHDNNPYISSATLKFDIRQTFKGFYAGVKGVTYNVAENGTDYYIDYENLGVRLISLNSCNVNVSATYAYGTSTASWLETALDTQHTVIAIMHVSPIPTQVWNNNKPSNNESIKNALQDFVDGGGKLIQFSGHSHVDAAYISPWLSIMQVCQKFEQADITTEAYGKMSGYIDGLGNPARTAETYTEDAWSVCVFKPYDDMLDMIRFGAGVDRHFHLTPIAPTTVTSILDNVTWSTSDATVATVSNGVITGVASGTCAILAKDSTGNYECWTVQVE